MYDQGYFLKTNTPKDVEYFLKLRLDFYSVEKIHLLPILKWAVINLNAILGKIVLVFFLFFLKWPNRFRRYDAAGAFYQLEFLEACLNFHLGRLLRIWAKRM